MKPYDISNPDVRDHAVREAIQDLILYGLSQAGPFRKAAFIGDTALRMFHGLDRFSDDLDFMIMDSCNFDIKEYFPILENRLSAFGIRCEIAERIRKASKVAAGEVRASTRELYMTFFSEEGYGDEVCRTQLTKIRLEIDTAPAKGALYEWKIRTNPFIHEIAACDGPSLFAGKIHALLFHGRVKGRDLYDYLFFVSKEIPFNINFLNGKIRQTGSSQRDLTLEEITGMLRERFSTIDYESARRDVLPFVDRTRKEEVKKWDKELFIQTTEAIRCEGTSAFKGEYIDNGSLAHARLEHSRRGVPPRRAR